MDEHRIPLFTYGILQFPEILTVLLGEENLPSKMLPAELEGYRRFRKPITNGIMRGPGIVASPRHSTRGTALFGLSEASLKIIDALEGGYGRIMTPIFTETFLTDAFVYIPKNLDVYAVEEPWDEEEFRAKGLEYYRTVRIPEILATLDIPK
jgi:hypothetical protein